MVVVGYVTIVLRVKNPYSMPIFKIAFFGASCSSAASSSDLDRSLQGVYGGFLKWGDSRLTMDFRLLKWSNDLDDLGVTTPQIFVYKYHISKCKHCWENNRVYEYRCKNVNVQVYDYIHNSADVCKYYIYIYIVYIYIVYIYIYRQYEIYLSLKTENVGNVHRQHGFIPDTKGWQSGAVLKPSLAFDTRLGALGVQFYLIRGYEMSRGYSM